MDAHRLPKEYGWQSTQTAIFLSLISKELTAKREAIKE